MIQQWQCFFGRIGEISSGKEAWVKKSMVKKWFKLTLSIALSYFMSLFFVVGQGQFRHTPGAHGKMVMAKNKKSAVEKKKKQSIIGSTSTSKVLATPETVITHPTGMLIPGSHLLMVDMQSNMVLASKNALTPMCPASMTKIMTALMVFKAIKEGTITAQTQFITSANAFGLEGTSMHLNLGTQVSVSDLLKGLLIASGNDAAVVLAEGLSGTEAQFCQIMTDFAKELGATNTHFLNANGLPQPNHVTTARDLATMSFYLIKDFSDWLWLFKEPSVTFGKNTYYTKNRLLRHNIGCEGLKTGHCKESGYGMVAYCVQNGRPILLVINGLPTEREREKEVLRLIQWAYSGFENFEVFGDGQIVKNIPLWYGVDHNVPVVLEKPLIVSIPNRPNLLKIKAFYNNCLVAPLKKGQVVGRLVVTHPHFVEPVEVALICGKTVELANPFKQLLDSLQYLFWGTRMQDDEA